MHIQEARRQEDPHLKTALQQVQPMLNGVNAFLKHLFGVTTLVARSCSPRGMVSADWAVLHVCSSFHDRVPVPHVNILHHKLAALMMLQLQGLSLQKRPPRFAPHKFYKEI